MKRSSYLYSSAATVQNFLQVRRLGCDIFVPQRGNWKWTQTSALTDSSFNTALNETTVRSQVKNPLLWHRGMLPRWKTNTSETSPVWNTNSTCWASHTGCDFSHMTAGFTTSAVGLFESSLDEKDFRPGFCFSFRPPIKRGALQIRIIPGTR